MKKTYVRWINALYYNFLENKLEEIKEIAQKNNIEILTWAKFSMEVYIHLRIKGSSKDIKSFDNAILNIVKDKKHYRNRNPY